MQRMSGVLLPIFSLPGDFGVGSLGREAHEFLDLLSAGGFSWWQMLPLARPAAGNSPYSSFSAFGYDYFYIDLPTLAEQGLITAAELEAARLPETGVCDYESLHENRFSLLARAAARLPDRAPVYAFLEAHPELEEFCRFMALRRENGGAHFRDFTTDTYEGEYYFAWAFTQYEFHRQFTRLHEAAAARGIRLLGDIPIYVHENSADVCFHPDIFCLDARHAPTAVAGVPPDAFSEEGQLWGNPLYDWEKMQGDGFLWWRRRMRHMFSLFDGVRIDHFRAFASYYSIPLDAASAKEGEWLRGPGMALVSALIEEAGDKLLIAEDLGGETPDVQALLSESGLPGMRVFQFANPWDVDSAHAPHNYPENAIAYTGTHDNDTLFGYLCTLPHDTRARLFSLCGYMGEDLSVGFSAVLTALYESRARLVVLPAQDLLRLGSEARTNRPGIPEGNWRFRLRRGELEGADLTFFARLAARTDRH